ncbi:MAG: hypothetical protein M3070_07060, partial [Actinomycetota bacterium]|nr:hypothetical protein [Actinomycetota bacterium]
MTPARWLAALPAGTRLGCWEYLAAQTPSPPVLPLAEATLERLGEPCLIDDRAYGVLRLRDTRYLVHATAPDQVHAGPV